MMTTEQFLSAQRTNLDVVFGLSSKAFEAVEKLIELNVQTAKASMTEAADATRALLAAKDPQEVMALQAGFFQPAAEKAAAYGRHVYEIATSANAEVARVAEATASDAQAKFLALVDDAAKNAPAGSENAVALVKSAVAAATNAIEGAQKAAKQAADVAEANFQAMSTTAQRATQAGTAKAKRGA